MCIVLTMSQGFAISGGPFGGPAQVDVRGTYAGVLIPIRIAPDPAQPDQKLPPDDSLALFTLSVPQSGLASGTAVVFRNGIFYSGTIKGTADTTSAKLSAIVQATFLQISEQVSTSSGTTTLQVISSEYDASGKLANASIVATQAGLTSAGTRIRGTASITYKNLNSNGATPDPAGESGGPIEYRIRGFKQSSLTSS
ncbi:MAG: hypothetical protein QOG67_2831 [Verrucomicrobiota bacterium]